MTTGPGLPANAETLFRVVAAAADALYVVDAAGRIPVDLSSGRSVAVAITELRRLAHGVHPAELSRRGLVFALRELARRSAIPVDVEVTDMERLQPEIEATAYYIAAEATANAVKHGNAGHVNIALARTANALQRLTPVSPAGGPTIVTADLPDDGYQAARR